MKKRKSRTKLLANLLMSKPKIVSDIFEMGAKNAPVPDIVSTINEYWEMERKWNVKLTEHYVWSLFHRRAPFQNPAFYREVMESHKTSVAGRLYSTTPTFSLDDDNGDDKDESDHRRALLKTALKHGLAYGKALDAIEESGLDRASARNWCEVTIEVMNSVETEARK
jgi:hypothetical protein